MGPDGHCVLLEAWLDMVLVHGPDWGRQRSATYAGPSSPGRPSTGGDTTGPEDGARLEVCDHANWHL